mgnify:CR=1 FL=1
MTDKKFFIKFVTDPAVDQFKSGVGLGCAAQAINDGYFVNVFFAAAAVQLIHKGYVKGIAASLNAPEGMFEGFLETIIEGANGIYCSTQSQMVFGVSPDSQEDLVDGIDLHWSGPDGVVSLASESDVILVY